MGSNRGEGVSRRRFGWKRVLLVAVFLILAGMGFVAGISVVRPDWRFRGGERVRHLVMQAELEEVDEGELGLVSLPVDEMEDGERVWMSQAALLINQEYSIGEEFQAEIGEYEESGVRMNACVMEAYGKLAYDIEEKFGEKLFVKSAYRTSEEQAAEYEADHEVAAVVGSSEHQAGLALDVYVKNYGGKSLLKTEAGQYVNRECGRYGFIIRYPEGKEDVTGIGFEPWHIRYVGIPHAKIMYRNNWTLEEYYENLEVGDFYAYEGYLISRQRGSKVKIPAEYEKIGISPDNQGNYLITVQMKR